jgi:hypothetical protein
MGRVTFRFNRSVFPVSTKLTTYGSAIARFLGTSARRRDARGAGKLLGGKQNSIPSGTGPTRARRRADRSRFHPTLARPEQVQPTPAFRTVAARRRHPQQVNPAAARRESPRIRMCRERAPEAALASWQLVLRDGIPGRRPGGRARRCRGALALGVGAYDFFLCVSTVRYGPAPRQQSLIRLATRVRAGGTITHPAGLTCLLILYVAPVDVLLAQRRALPNPWQ